MVTLDPAVAVQNALDTSSMPGSGLCLRFVDESFGTPTSRLRSGSGIDAAPEDGHWLQAQDGWWYSTDQHPGDGTDAPAGVPVFYSQMVGGDKAGHIVMSLGGGMCRTTTGTRVITQSIAELNEQRPSIDNPDVSSVLGWTGNYGNNPIAGITQEDDMTPDQAKTLDDLAWSVGQMRAQVNKMQGQVDDLATGKGLVHTKLDQINYALSDPKVGLRQKLGELDAKIPGK